MLYPCSVITGSTAGSLIIFSTYGSLTKNIVILVRLDWSVSLRYFTREASLILEAQKEQREIQHW